MYHSHVKLFINLLTLKENDLLVSCDFLSFFILDIFWNLGAVCFFVEILMCSVSFFQEDLLKSEIMCWTIISYNILKCFKKVYMYIHTVYAFFVFVVHLFLETSHSFWKWLKLSFALENYKYINIIMNLDPAEIVSRNIVLGRMLYWVDKHPFSIVEVGGGRKWRMGFRFMLIRCRVSHFIIPKICLI